MVLTKLSPATPSKGLIRGPAVSQHSLTGRDRLRGTNGVEAAGIKLIALSRWAAVLSTETDWQEPV